MTHWQLISLETSVVNVSHASDMSTPLLNSMNPYIAILHSARTVAVSFVYPVIFHRHVRTYETKTADAS